MLSVPDNPRPPRRSEIDAGNGLGRSQQPDPLGEGTTRGGSREAPTADTPLLVPRRLPAPLGASRPLRGLLVVPHSSPRRRSDPRVPATAVTAALLSLFARLFQSAVYEIECFQTSPSCVFDPSVGATGAGC